MATNKQRRETERQRLQRELVERRAREASRRRNGIIASVAGALVLVAAVVVIVVLAGSSGGGGKKRAGAPSSSAPTSAASSAQTVACGQKMFPAKTYPAATGASVSFQGVTVKGATDLAGSPTVTAKGSGNPAKLQYKDLVVGKGAAANPQSCVDVQYVGALYKNGTVFDKSWSRTQLQGKGQVSEFPLTGVVPGFTQGIGGTSGIPAMRIGGRRLVILPSSLGYGSSGQPQAGIPANSPLVFVIDLVGTRAAA